MTDVLDTTRPARPGRSWLRWTIPVAVAAAAVGVATAGRWLPASADDDVPARSPSQLLQDLQTARLDTLSGTVVQRSELGLPSLPLPSGRGSSELTSLIAGTHTWRVWYDGPTRARLALQGTLGESDVIRNGRDVWLWSSERKTAQHYQLPADAGATQTLPRTPAVTPQDAAKMALDSLDPSTVVTAPGAISVAGRTAHELVLTPRDTESLVGQVRIAIDAERHFPLRVQAFAAGAEEPALEVGFTQVSLAKPDAGQFRFTPPPGTTVDEQAGPDGDGASQRAPSAGLGEHPDRDAAMGSDGAKNAGQRPQVIGSGWTSVLLARGNATMLTGGGTPPDDSQRSGDGAGVGQVLAALPAVDGSWGSGRLLRSSLFSVLITDDGRVLAGMVAPQRLYEVADTTRAGS